MGINPTMLISESPVNKQSNHKTEMQLLLSMRDKFKFKDTDWLKQKDGKYIYNAAIPIKEPE